MSLACPPNWKQSSAGSISICSINSCVADSTVVRRVVDAGCGGGRNLPYFLRRGFDVRAVDADAMAIRSVRQLVASLSPALPPGQIHCGPLDSLPWEDASADAVICSAVLHFARDEREFAAMLKEMWRILAPRGLFFARLATSIGLERQLSSATGRMRLPDGSERFVVDEPDHSVLDIHTGWTARRSAQDDERAESAMYDDLGDGEVDQRLLLLALSESSPVNADDVSALRNRTPKRISGFARHLDRR